MDKTTFISSPKVSIIIINFNYQQFITEAINSALVQNYPNKEIIVVDDGSTDNSRQIIDKYENDIIKIYKENGGQIDSANRSFYVSSGEILVFLDSDDYLLSGCLDAIVNAWKPEYTKIHYAMEKRNKNGVFLGYLPHNCKLDSGDCKNIYLKKSFYRTTVTSGNAFSRKFLNSVMPLPCIEKFGLDGYLNTHAVLRGSIGKIEKPLVVYRQHELSDRARNVFSPQKIISFVNHEINRYNLTRQIVPDLVPRNFLLRYPERCFHFIAVKSLNLQALPPVIDKPISFLAARSFIAELLSVGSLRYRFGAALWFLALIIPIPYLQKMIITWKYSYTDRPTILKPFLKIMNHFFFYKKQNTFIT